MLFLLNKGKYTDQRFYNLFAIRNRFLGWERNFKGGGPKHPPPEINPDHALVFALTLPIMNSILFLLDWVKLRFLPKSLQTQLSTKLNLLFLMRRH